MRRLIRIDLPRRLSRRLPKPLTELLVGGGITGLFVGVRVALIPLLGDVAPFALSIMALVLATLIGGWRSGFVSMVLGIVLTWYLVLPPLRSFAFSTDAVALTLAMGALAEAVILLALALYEREVRRGQVERTRRINFLGHALREMDHRTKNNFQIVTSMLTLQANKSANPEVKSALAEANERLKAVAAVYDALAPSSHGLATVRLQDQLEEICGQIRRGILPEDIRLEAELEPMLVPHETAVAIGIIVNELVTNACKHAFPDGRGTIRVHTRHDGDGALIEVSDDGRGLPEKAKKGLGSRLIAAFVERVRGTTETRSSTAGTTHRLRVPLR